MCALFSLSKSNVIRQQCCSFGRMRGFFVPVSQRNLSTATIQCKEQPNKHEGIISKLKKIFRKTGIQFQDAESGSALHPKLKKQKNENRISRKMSNHQILNNNFLAKYYHSHLKYMRLDKIIANYKLESATLHRTNSLLSLGSIRGIMGLASYNSKPPIREPHIPEQREKKEDKKEKEKKKPVIRVDEKATLDLDKNLNLGGLEGNNHRYKWGIKLAEDSSAEKTPEPLPRYVTKNIWGVKVTKLVSETDNVFQTKEAVQNQDSVQIAEAKTMKKIKTEEVPNRFEVSNESKNPESSGNVKDLGTKKQETGVLIEKYNILTAENRTDSKTSLEVPNFESLKDNLYVPTTNADENILNENQQKSLDVKLSAPVQDSAEGVKLSAPLESVAEAEFNIPKDLPFDGEIFAWKEAVEKSKPSIAEIVKSAEPEIVHYDLDNIFIRPEAPEPKLDVQAVSSIDHAYENEENQEASSYKGIKSLRESKSVGYTSKKKIHTGGYQHFSSQRGDTDSLSFRKDVVGKAILFSGLESTNSFIKDRKKQEENLLEPFLIKGLLSVGGISAEFKSEDKLKEASNQIEAAIEMKNPLLPTKAVTLTRIHSDMSYYDAEIAREVDEIYGREIDIALSSPNAIGENIMDAHLPTEIMISVVPSSENKEGGIDWMPLLCTSNSDDNPGSYSSHNFFGSGSSDGSSGSRGRKKRGYFLNSQDDDDELVDKYLFEGDYVRVRGDPYPYSREHFNKWRVPRHNSPPPNVLMENPRKNLENQYNNDFVIDEKLRGYDQYSSYEETEINEEEIVSTDGEMETEKARQYYNWSKKMAGEREGYEEEIDSDREMTNQTGIVSDNERVEAKMAKNSGNLQSRSLELAENSYINRNTELMKTNEVEDNGVVEISRNTSSLDANLTDSEISKTASGPQKKIPTIQTDRK
ncbi:uncharacterized protein LOC117178787 isoform X2 [Belonocnema kinseyi]|uniref:uncharacterized protein LOC117178787 isoform X2 n=1 Tax=Belonocnema kinseyi TaxID=2817044 RepID=UPI00143DD913|nr:uncharacterized protein LOC117178787 isoform X2 [Belonocnema kinseyi]